MNATRDSRETVRRAIVNGRHAAVGIYRYRNLHTAEYVRLTADKLAVIFLGDFNRYWVAVGAQTIAALDAYGYDRLA